MVTALVLASTATMLAGTATKDGITLTWPNYTLSIPLFHCEPHNDPTAATITVSGVPAGSTVKVNFTFASPVPGTPLVQISQTFTNQDGTLTYSIPYPTDTTEWPFSDGETRQIVVAVSVAVIRSNGTVTKLNSGQWKVVCKPDEPDTGDFKGCTPGYWKQIEPPNDQHLDSWGPTGYAPADLYDGVFGVESHLNPPGSQGEIADPTLGQAIAMEGGGENALARHAVAALLNAAHPDVNYPLTVGEIIAIVQAAYASGDFESAHLLFEGYNEIGCPIS